MHGRVPVPGAEDDATAGARTLRLAVTGPYAKGQGGEAGERRVFLQACPSRPLDFLGALGQGKARHVRARKGGVQESGSDEQGEAFGLS